MSVGAIFAVLLWWAACLAMLLLLLWSCSGTP